MSKDKQSITEAVSEAESKPIEFDPNERARYIRTILRDIPNLVAQGLSEDEIRSKVPDFIELYPELFKKILRGQDLTPIQNMLSMLDQMGEGHISQHQASIIVGQKLVDRYVTPQLNGSYIP
jgi:hypothetical protein